MGNFRRALAVFIAAGTLAALNTSSAAPIVAITASELLVTAVHPSSTAGRASYFRFINPTNADGAYEVTLLNDHGQVLGTAHGIASAKSSAQIEVKQLESLALASTASESGKFLSAKVRAGFSGAFQHVVWDGAALSNLTSCPAQGEAASDKLFNVHTSRIAGFPSTIVISNAGIAAATAKLTISSNTTGAKLTDWTSPAISAGGTLTVSLAAIESATSWTPAADATHVSVSLDTASFTGTLQHLVDSGTVRTDMTLRCVLSATTLTTAQAPSESATIPAVSPVGAARQSFLRLTNPGTASGWYEVTLLNERGQSLGVSSGTVAGKTSKQLGIVELGINTAAETGKMLTAKVRLGFDGAVQHVTWDGSALANMTAGAATPRPASTTLYNVHTSRVAGYASSIVIANTGAAGAAKLIISDNLTGAKIAEWTSASINTGGSATVTMAAIESATSWTPPASAAHVTISLDPGFSGTLRHLVTNAAVNALTDMTPAYALRRTGTGTVLTGSVTNADPTRSARVVVTPTTGAKQLLTANVAGDGSFSVAGLDAAAEYSVAVEQPGGRFERASSVPMVAGDTVVFTRAPWMASLRTALSITGRRTARSRARSMRRT
jgi:hypothetical protein